MECRFLRTLFAAAILMAAIPFQASAAPVNACSVVTRADVGSAVGHGAVTPGKKMKQYAGDPTSVCQYDTEAGNVVVTFDPTNHNQFFSSYKAGYASSLQSISGIGDAAIYYRQHGTLIIRKGQSVLMLTLDSPDDQRDRTILFALGRHVTPRIH